MAWTNLTFAFGSLLTSTKMTQLDANIDALAVGDSGAPNIIDNAHTPITAGSTYLSDWTGVGQAIETANSLTLQSEGDNFNRIVIERDGVYEVDFDLKTTVGADTASGRVYKNDVAFGTLQTEGGASFVTQSENLTLSEGDYLDLYISISGGGTSAEARDFKVSAAVKQLG